MATSNRPQVIAAKEVSAAVDQAVKLAVAKHQVKFGPDFSIGPGTIMGRYLLESATALNQAEQRKSRNTSTAKEQPVWRARHPVMSRQS